MMISLELGHEYQQTLASLSSMGRAVAEATSKGLGLAVQHAANYVGKNKLSGQELKARSGDLRNATQGWKESEFEGVVGVREGSAVDRYKYLLGDETVTIKSKKGGLLSIPLPDAQKGSGLLKDEYSVGLKNIDGGYFMESKGTLFFVKRRGKTDRSKLLFLFVMAKEVMVFGTGALLEGVLDAEDGMTDIIVAEVGAAIEK